MVLTLLRKNKLGVVCQSLLYKCCMDTGLVSWELAKMLDLPALIGVPRSQNIHHCCSHIHERESSEIF
jgi:hypothetical protein